MKRICQYFLFLLLVWSCERRPEKVTHHLKKRTVFLIPDPVDSASIIKERFLEQNKDSSYIEYVFRNYDLVNVQEMDSSILIDLRYADTLNFLKTNMYDGLRRAYLTCETAIKVCAAQYYLKQINPSLSLVILDASRPQHIQKLMWDSLKMEPDKKYNYLSPPYETSMHNYGCAVDVTIRDLSSGKNLDMGTRYDHFVKLSQPVYETRFVKSGQLSREAFENRRLLRYVMRRAGMNAINSEWWHFSSMSKSEAMARYPLIK